MKPTERAGMARHANQPIGLAVLLLAASLLPAIVPPSVMAQPAHTREPWVSTGGPLGGLGYDIRYNFGDPDVWYVTDAWSGVHRSTNRGIDWSPSNAGITAVWGPASDAVPIFSLTVDPHDPDILWAGTQNTGQIFKSTDAGANWIERSQGIDALLRPHLSFRGFTVDPDARDTVYAMGEIGSPSWTDDEDGFESGLQFDMTQGIVYRSTDAGTSWTEIRRDQNLARYCWIEPTNPDLLYVSTGIFDREASNTDVMLEIAGGVGILKSDDGGTSWDVLDESQGLTDLYVSSLFMSPDEPEVLLAAAAHDAWSGRPPQHTGGVFRSDDGGRSWTRVLQGELFSVVEICPSDSAVAYAASYQATYRSDDGGSNWQRFNRPDGTWGSPGLVAGIPIDMQCDPDDPMRVAVNNYLGGNFLSRNGGETWLSASRGYTGALVRDVAVSPDRASTVFAGSRSGVFRSDDGGGHWVGTQYPPPELILPGAPIKLTEINALAVDPQDPAHIVVSSCETPGLIVSEDEGRSWRLAPLPTGVFCPLSLAFAPEEPGLVWAATAPYGRCKEESGADPAECNTASSGVSLSEDGGSTWRRPGGSDLDGIGTLTVEPHPLQPDTVLVGTHNSGVYRSEDRGDSWSAIGVGPPALPTLPVLDLAIHPLDPSLVFAGLQDGAIYRSTDGGTSFVQSSSGLSPNARIFSVVVDPTDIDIVYAADDRSGVYASTDGGASWHPISLGLVHHAVHSLALSRDGSVLYAGVDGAGVWRLGDPAPEPAVHDTCELAVELGPATYAEIFSHAGTDGASGCASPPAADLWYRYRATANGVLHVNTCGTHDVGVIDSGLDTVVSLHDGCPGTPENLLSEGCNDDSTSGNDPAACDLSEVGNPRDSALAVPLAVDQQVWIRVESREVGALGEFWLSVQPDYPPAGQVPDGSGFPGDPLRLDKSVVGTLLLNWSSSCRTTDTDYSVYRGTLGDYDGLIPETCSTGQARSWETGLAGGDAYFLIVPHNDLNEGSYGLAAPSQQEVERAASLAACRPQVIGECGS